MKRKTAKEILAESFREIAEKKPISKITVRDITDNCGYSPATFYRHFNDKYDLITYDYSTHIESIIAKTGTDGYQWKRSVYESLRYFEENRSYIRNLLLNTSGMDAFERNLIVINTAQLTESIKKISGIKELTSDLAIYVQLYVSGTVQIICHWVTGEPECTSEHLAELFEKALPEPLRKHLEE